jgi:hypothetical protein
MKSKMKWNHLLLNASAAVFAVAFSAPSFAKTILSCTDASAPSIRGYFAKSVEINVEPKGEQSEVSVRTVLAPFSAALAGENSVEGTTQKVLETIVVGNTSNYVLEKSDLGTPLTVLVADLEAKKAALLYYGAVPNISLTQFLSCK